MGKPRLITFGCSYTLGQWLEENQFDGKKWTPSPKAWPQLLGDMLGRTVINKGNPGSSNLEILHTILTFPFKEDDLVVVGWTHVNRDCIFDKRKNVQVGHWTEETLRDHWIQTHTDYDLSIRAGLYIHHAELFLESLGLRQYHFRAVGWDRLIDRILDSLTEVKPIPTNKLKHQIKKRLLYKKDLALDNAHPGVKAHEEAARELYKIINEK